MTTTRTTSALVEQPLARWAVWAAHGCALVVLPSCLWRLAMGFHVPVGWPTPLPWYSIPYTLALSILSEALALLAIGLVKPWGVVYPSWLPFVGGRRVHPAVALVPAFSGAAVLTVMSVLTAVNWDRDGEGPTGFAGVVLISAYAPLLLWGPLLAVAATGYWVRVRRLRHAR